MLGSTEEFKKRQENRANAAMGARTKDKRKRLIQDTRPIDWVGRAKIKALERDIATLNAADPFNPDPWVKDHIRPLSQGGREEIGNLRPLRNHKNSLEQYRTEEEINRIQALWHALRNPVQGNES